MFNKLLIAWRNPHNRLWTPVGILEYKNEKYLFSYTNGAKVDKFIPFGPMQDLNKQYESNKLFQIFQNRLLSKSRPEYLEYLNWLDIDENENTDLLELSRSRGIRATDELQIFPIPEKNSDDYYEVLFFAHGISHISKTYLERLSNLKKDDRLFIMKDVQNEYDQYALMLRTENDPVELMGYCPSFFAKDFNKLLDLNGNSNVEITVHKINEDAPLQLKLLCKFRTKWHKEFQPFKGEEFSVISS